MMPSGNALGHAAIGAKRDSSSKKRKSSSTVSNSEDSDVAVQRHEKRRDKNEKQLNELAEV
jgi:hypothetical protein